MTANGSCSTFGPSGEGFRLTTSSGGTTASRRGTSVEWMCPFTSGRERRTDAKVAVRQSVRPSPPTDTAGVDRAYEAAGYFDHWLTTFWGTPATNTVDMSSAARRLGPDVVVRIWSVRGWASASAIPVSTCRRSAALSAGSKRVPSPTSATHQGNEPHEGHLGIREQVDLLVQILGLAVTDQQHEAVAGEGGTRSVRLTLPVPAAGPDRLDSRSTSPPRRSAAPDPGRRRPGRR